MATCDECLHFTVCEALEQGNGINKVHPIQCGCFKDKANVVEVVRCKDCKHWIYWADQKRCSCIKHHIQSNSYDFCSYGELKELGK